MPVGYTTVLRMVNELLETAPEILALVALALVVCFTGGWLGRGVGARRSEEQLKRDILAAKGSIPQLESSLRKREAQVHGLEAEIQELGAQAAQATETLAATEHELRTSHREARNLRSELKAVKGESSEPSNVIMDGFEDEPAETADDPRLARVQALYDKLKTALLERDEQIAQLETQLATPAAATADQADEVTAAADPLPHDSEGSSARLVELEATVDQLRGQLAESEQQRDMLAEMAKHRTEANQQLKAESAQTQAQIPELEGQLALHEQTIATREASIKRLLDELEELTKAKQASDAEGARLSRSNEAQAATLSEQADRISNLEISIGQRDARISVLDQDLQGVRAQLDALRHATQSDDPPTAESAPDTAVREAEDLRATLKQQDRWLAKLKDSLAQREAKLATAEAEASSAKAHADRLAESLRVYRSAVTESEIRIASPQPAQVVTLRPHRKRLRRHSPQRFGARAAGARAATLPFRPRRRTRRPPGP